MRDSLKDQLRTLQVLNQHRMVQAGFTQHSAGFMNDESGQWTQTYAMPPNSGSFTRGVQGTPFQLQAQADQIRALRAQIGGLGKDADAAKQAMADILHPDRGAAESAGYAKLNALSDAMRAAGDSGGVVALGAAPVGAAEAARTPTRGRPPSTRFTRPSRRSRTISSASRTAPPRRRSATLAGVQRSAGSRRSGEPRPRACELSSSSSPRTPTRRAARSSTISTSSRTRRCRWRFATPIRSGRRI